MHTGNSAPDGPDDRQTETEGEYAVSRRTVLKGAAAAALGGPLLRTATRPGRARHADRVDWTAAALDADGASAEFGSALALDAEGERLVVGDPMRRDGAVRPGGVSVYRREDGDWTREALLLPPYRARLDEVGDAVAIDAAGETIAVGVPGEDARAGQCGTVSVYVREDDEWAHETRLFAEDASNRDRLGRAVALDDAGERVLAGAPGDSVGGETSGAAYVFDRTDEDGDASWSQTQKLAPPDGSAGDRAGAAVSLAGDGRTALVGAPGANDGEGAVIVFADDPWGRTDRVDAPDDGGAAFGHAVATNGRDAVVGAPDPSQTGSDSDTDSDSDSDSGVATGETASVASALTAGAWHSAQRLVADSGPAGERFGTGVGLAADGDSAVVASIFDGESDGDEGESDSDDGESDGDDDSPPSTGCVRVYVRDEDGWTQSHRHTPDDPAAVTRFGRSVAVDGDGYLVAVAGQRDDAADGSSMAAMPRRPEESAAPTGTVTVFQRESPEISIDIEPDEEWPAKIPRGGPGAIAVGIEHTDRFDPALVDVETLRFGPPRVVDEGGGARAVGDGRWTDFDTDGDEDLVVDFPADDTGFAADDFAARLVGETVYGTPVSDHDFVITTDGDGTGGDDGDDSGDSGEGDEGTGDGGDGENSDSGSDGDSDGDAS
ncbi:FG-GAP repeat protein [Halosimplex salinum]|uniref:FG-GAP repeat protein n=1 Tax=Halosimplex salinum TaxID=1710538 RepID=UPI000F4AC06E|nr:FG-GAP repeat protein [Halosimplex salinum]